MRLRWKKAFKIGGQFYPAISGKFCAAIDKPQDIDSQFLTHSLAVIQACAAIGIPNSRIWKFGDNSGRASGFKVTHRKQRGAKKLESRVK